MVIVGQSLCVLQFVPVVSHTSTELVFILELEIQVGRVQVLCHIRQTECNAGIKISDINGFVVERKMTVSPGRSKCSPSADRRVQRFVQLCSSLDKLNQDHGFGWRGGTGVGRGGERRSSGVCLHSLDRSPGVGVQGGRGM